MLQAMRKRLHNDEEGFSLIELMVVVLIIAILIAIAVPTFLGARQKAQARGVQRSEERRVGKERRACTDKCHYITTAGVQGIEPRLKFSDTAIEAQNPKEVLG